MVTRQHEGLTSHDTQSHEPKGTRVSRVEDSNLGRMPYQEEEERGGKADFTAIGRTK